MEGDLGASTGLVDPRPPIRPSNSFIHFHSNECFWPFREPPFPQSYPHQFALVLWPFLKLPAFKKSIKSICGPNQFQSSIFFNCSHSKFFRHHFHQLFLIVVPPQIPHYKKMSSRSSKTLLLFICALAALLQLPAMFTASVEPSGTEMSCAQLAGSDEERLLLCQLYESSALLAQLGALVNDGIERLASTQGLARAIGSEGPRMEKRKHEYLRFGKRKHEFVRFG